MGCPSSVVLGDNLVFSICCHDPDTGVLTDADAVPAYRIYEDETGTAILNDNMAKLDDASYGYYHDGAISHPANAETRGQTGAILGDRSSLGTGLHTIHESR